MKGPTSAVRFSEAQKLLDYGFSNFEYIELSQKDDVLKQVNVEKGVSLSVNAIFENNSGVLIKKGESKNIETKINVPDTISAPVKAGQKLGDVSYFIGESSVATSNIIAQESIKNISLKNIFERVIKSWGNLFR